MSAKFCSAFEIFLPGFLGENRTLALLGSLPFSPDGQLQRRHVLVVDLVDVRPPLQQDLDNLLPAAADSIVEWCGVPGMEPSSFLTNIHTESWGYLG